METTGGTSTEALSFVECHLALDVVDHATVVLQIVPASTAGAVQAEELAISIDGRSVEVRELEGDRGGHVHVVKCTPGALTIDLWSTIARFPAAAETPATGLDTEQLTYLRQSRYCPSDELSGFAAYELGHLKPSPELLIAVADWVGSRLTYEVGSSGPLDSAVDSLFHGRGVCRDFANLAITMLRALDVPARLVAVYSPGLSPMDFHAVVEAHVQGRWWVIDPTRLAPRQTLLRITTGRDAADTAFLASIGGEVRLNAMEVSAFTEGDLPLDDHAELVSLA